MGALIVAGIPACGASTELQPPRVSGSPGARPAVPATLESFESAAEDIGEAARAKDWSKAGLLLQAGRVSWSNIRSRVQADGAPSGSVSLIDASMHRLAVDIVSNDAKAAESDANTVGGAIAELFALYSSAVPVDVLRLDVAFRRAQIGAEYEDWPEVAGGLSDVRTVWLRLRSDPLARIRTARAASTTERMEDVIRRLAGALEQRAARAAETSAAEGLQLVDDLERLFR